MNCKDCKFWHRGSWYQHTTSGYTITQTNPKSKFGLCSHPSVRSECGDSWTGNELPLSVDGVNAHCDESRGCLEVGELFGCIHFVFGTEEQKP